MPTERAPSEILEAAESFEKFVAAGVAGQKLSKEALSKIEKVASTVGKIVTAETGSDFEE